MEKAGERVHGLEERQSWSLNERVSEGMRGEASRRFCCQDGVEVDKRGRPEEGVV